MRKNHPIFTSTYFIIRKVILNSFKNFYYFVNLNFWLRNASLVKVNLLVYFVGNPLITHSHSQLIKNSANGDFPSVILDSLSYSLL